MGQFLQDGENGLQQTQFAKVHANPFARYWHFLIPNHTNMMEKCDIMNLIERVNQGLPWRVLRFIMNPFGNAASQHLMHLDLESKWEYRTYINVKYMISWNLNRDAPMKKWH